MTRQEAIYEALERLHDYDLNEVAQTLAERGLFDEDEIWHNLDLGEILYQVNDADDFRHFLVAAHDRDFDPRDSYWRNHCYYGPQSSDDLDYDLDDFAEIIDEYAEENWTRSELPREIVDVLEEYDTTRDDYDDSAYPTDTTDYDGVDDYEEENNFVVDTPEPETAAHEIPIVAPSVLTANEIAALLREMYPPQFGGDSLEELAPIINLLQLRCMTLHGHYMVSEDEYREMAALAIPYEPA